MVSQIPGVFCSWESLGYFKRLANSMLRRALYRHMCGSMEVVGGPVRFILSRGPHDLWQYNFSPQFFVQEHAAVVVVRFSRLQ